MTHPELLGAPDALLARIAKGEISEDEVIFNGRILWAILDKPILNGIEKKEVEALLRPPIRINPNVSRDKTFRLNGLSTPTGCLLGLVLESADRADYVQPLLDLGFDYRAFAENYFFLSAVKNMPVSTLWQLQQAGFNIHEADKKGGAFFAAIDAEQPDKIVPLTQMGIDGNTEVRSRVSGGYVVVPPFTYACQWKRASLSIVLALIENGWGSVRFNETKYTATTCQGEVFNHAYTQGLAAFCKAHEQAARSLIASEGMARERAVESIDVKQLLCWHSLGRLADMMQPEFWQGHETKLLELYSLSLPHIQAQMGPVLPLIGRGAAQSVIALPVAEWSRSIVPATRGL